MNLQEVKSAVDKLTVRNKEKMVSIYLMMGKYESAKTVSTMTKVPVNTVMKMFALAVEMESHFMFEEPYWKDLMSKKRSIIK